MKKKCNRFKGFTLLEMLVVLVLVSLTSTLIFQGFSYVLHLRSRFLVALDDLQVGMLQTHWFQSSTGGIVADYRDSEHIFNGDAHLFSGLTISALDEVPGTPTPFAWQIEQVGETTFLSYRDSQGKSWEISRWLGEAGNFRYMAADGEWHDQWPPQFGLESPQLPTIIVFNGKRRQTPLTWIVKLVDFNKDRVDVREDLQ
jgi:general secretion pathway protein J